MRIVLADDSVLLREGVAQLLAQVGFDVVGLAGDAEELLEQVERHRPDVAIIDIRMPPTHTDEGLHAAHEIRTRHPNVGVLVLSQYVRPSYAFELLRDGADRVGYLLKDRVSNLDELSDAVRRVADGGTVLDPLVVSKLVGRPRDEEDALADLSDREREVLALMAEGRTNQAIAERLFITERTVEKHVKHIFAKLRLPSSPEAHRRVLAVVAYLRA